MNRRSFICAGMGLAWLGTHESQAQATDYRALVCIALIGGNDSFNTFIPWDTESFDAYMRVRASIALARTDLVPVNDFLAFHPRLQSMGDMWRSGELAVVHGLGPLARPTTSSDYLKWRPRNDSTLLPEMLYSHSHQQSLWEAGGTRPFEPYGWFARIAQQLSGRSETFSLAGNRRLVTGAPGGAIALPPPGGGYALGAVSFSPGDERGRIRRAAFDTMLANESSNAIHRAYVVQQRSALRYATQLDELMRQAPTGGNADPVNGELSSAFGHLIGPKGGYLSKQLYQVAKMIKHRSTLGGTRHLYLVMLPGFDTHARQRNVQDPLLGELATAVGGFQAAMQAIGAWNQVTCFTISEFGRTVSANASSGTDHGWAGDQIVLGGAVEGGRSFGRYSSLQPGGIDDAGHGRRIPSTSVDQYAATLARWWGIDDAGLTKIFPNLANFASRDIGFFRIG